MREVLTLGLYRVTSEGEVESLHSGSARILKQSVMTDGYCRVGLCHLGKVNYVKCHRFIAIALIPNPDDKPEVNHKDGVKSHNHPLNLEWATFSENIKHAVDTGLIIHAKGEELPQAKITEIQVREILKLGASRKGKKRTFLSNAKIGALYGIKHGAVRAILARENWGWLS
jgi:hypothetical protein